MKITIDIDCTPQEARQFLGLRDVEALQQALIDQLRARMSENLAAVDPDQLLKTWLPAGVAGMEQLQKMFFSQLTGAGQTGDKD